MVEREEIIKLAKLSKLTFSDAEIDKLTGEMQSVISFADEISAARCDEEKDIQAEEIKPMREDVVKPSISREDVLFNAKTPEDGFFKLPRRSE